MARKNCRSAATSEQLLTPLCTHCGLCGQPMRIAYRTRRTITTLQGICCLTLRVRRCHNHQCPQYHRPYRPEEEGRWALPHGEFGLDVIALIGTLRYAAHRSIPEIHQALRERGVQIAERTVTHLLQRYEELVALHLGETARLRERLKEQGQVILALDGLQPDVGHEVLWVLRDCCSGEILGARRMPERHREGSGATVGGSSELVPRSLGSDQRGNHRWAALSAECSRERLTGDSSPVVPLPLPAGSGETGV